MRPKRVYALLATVAIGCGPGANYDGLTGGVRDTDSSPTMTSEITEDDSLAAPRPVAPLSVSVIPTKRPLFRWANVPGSTGATLEVSKTRKFDANATQSFAFDGEEAEVPVDLEPGMWFWRVRARAPGRVGKVWSPTWQVYVRGPMKKGASQAPLGGLLDMNGDGYADLAVAADDKIEGQPFGVLVLFGGGPVEISPQPIDGTVFPRYVDADITLSGGFDMDGDGIVDIAHSGLAQAPAEQVPDVAPPDPPDAPFLVTLIEMGFLGVNEHPRSMDVKILGPGSVPSSLAMAGDVDGDGYGDLLHDDGAHALLSRGGEGGLHSLVPLFPTAGGGGRLPMAAGFDSNGDGLTDFVHRADEDRELRHATLVTGDANVDFVPRRLLGPSAADAEIRAFATGDFNGDALADVAFSTKRTSGPGGGEVCVFYGDRSGTPRPGPCIAGLGDEEWGIALTAVDLDGSGTDELVVGARRASGTVYATAVSADESVLLEEIDLGIGTVLTTIEPGYAGKRGLWAATADVGRGVVRIFRGREMVQELSPPFGETRFGRALR